MEKKQTLKKYGFDNPVKTNDKKVEKLDVITMLQIKQDLKKLVVMVDSLQKRLVIIENQTREIKNV